MSNISGGDQLEKNNDELNDIHVFICILTCPGKQDN